jgi:hypothetical protein
MNNLQPTGTVPAAKPKMSQWGKILGNAQSDTIKEESVEVETKVDNNLNNAIKTPHLGVSDSQDAPLTARDVNVALTSSTTVPLNVNTNSALSPAEQQLIASLYDIRLEIKEEICSLNEKMNKIDHQISEILSLFTPHCSPCSSHSASCAAHSYSSSTNNSCNSSVTSHHSHNTVNTPPGSVPSSPNRSRKKQTPPTPGKSSSSSSLAKSSAQIQQSSDTKTTSSSSQKCSSDDSRAGDNSRTNTPTSRGSNSSSSRKSSAKRKRSKKVAPHDMDAVPPTGDDDENVPIKDRDLDIL